jgi:hypothetical protein
MREKQLSESKSLRGIADLARVERPANPRSWIEGQVKHPQY